METESFYLTLPSDSSMAVHPNNVGGAYSVDLPLELQMNSHMWTCGLAEIIFNQDWTDIIRDDITAAVCLNDIEGGKWSTCGAERLTTDEANEHYSCAKDFIEGAIKPLLDRTFNSIGLKDCDIVMTLDKDERLTISTTLIHSSKRPIRLELSTTLFQILGFTPAQLIKNRFFQTNSENKLISPKSHFPVKVSRGISSLWVYVDCIQPHIVGHQLSPLLRVIAVDPTIKNDTSRVLQFEKPYYFPLNNDNIQTIRVNIFNNGGKEVVTFASPVICKLHFRRVKGWNNPI